MNTHRQKTLIRTAALMLAASFSAPVLAQAEGETASYAEIRPLLEANCLSCHGANTARKGVRFDTEELAVKFSERAAEELSQGKMPPRRPSFKATTEGQALLNWFSAQKENATAP